MVVEMKNKTLNSLLLMGVMLSLLLEGILRMQAGWIAYFALLTSLLLFANCVYRKQFHLTYFDLFMVAAFVLHWLLSPDKLTSLILMTATLLLYQSVLALRFSYRYIVYPILVIFFMSVVLTLPAMVHSFTATHSSRAGLYEGFFQNPNTNAAFMLSVIFIAYVFLRQRRLRWTVYVVAFVAILATGSRNALLCIILACFFSFVGRTRFRRLAFPMFMGILAMALAYLFFFEMNSNMSLSFMGKEANSAGRAEQIASVVLEYPLNLFGNGREVIDLFSKDENGYAVHNFYISSLYSYGIVILLGYMWFVFKIHRHLRSHKTKAVWLVFQFYFFFEPGVCFYFKFLNVFPLLLVLIMADGSRDCFRRVNLQRIVHVLKVLKISPSLPSGASKPSNS